MSFLTLDKVRGAAAPSRNGKASQTLPSVNLLPFSTLEALLVRRIVQRFVAAGVAGALLVGGGYALQTQRLHSAQDRLAAEQALTPALSAQVTALAPVAAFYSLLTARQQTASAAMAAEVLFSDALTDLAGRTPAGIDIATMAVTLTPSTVIAVAPPISPLEAAGIDANGNVVTGTQASKVAGTSLPGASAVGAASSAAATTGAGAAATDPSNPDVPAAPTAPVTPPVTCARPDPFNPAPIIGCVALTGRATSRAAVGQLVQNLRAADLYADPFVTTTTISGVDGAEEVAFAGSVGLTGKAVSGRYAELSWLSDPKVLAKAEKMIAAGNTASSRLAARAKAAAAAAKAKVDAEAAAKAAAELKAQKKAEKALSQQLEAAAAAAAAAAALANQNATADTSKGE